MLHERVQFLVHPHLLSVVVHTAPIVTRRPFFFFSCLFWSRCKSQAEDSWRAGLCCADGSPSSLFLVTSPPPAVICSPDQCTSSIECVHRKLSPPPHLSQLASSVLGPLVQYHNQRERPCPSHALASSPIIHHHPRERGKRRSRALSQCNHARAMQGMLTSGIAMPILATCVPVRSNNWCRLNRNSFRLLTSRIVQRRI